ncbi:MAG: ATP-binding protein [Eubacteriales bacterium]|nr:ATP-binding protein [Eubacteriales bacterium]MDD3882927.1 ATP-binding protein [Eubacteriales bacterium]MDD4513526.1 ATP-binding protein [Eubacteriales bacterium]
MAIISRTKTKKRYIALRWKILFAFLLIIGAAFVVVAEQLTTLVGDYLFEQKISTERVELEKLALSVTDDVGDYLAQNVYSKLLNAGAAMGGRLIVVDDSGKVQTDTYSKLNGKRLSLTEVSSVLSGEKLSDYGLHHFGAAESTQTGSGALLLSQSGDSNEWAGYYTTAIYKDESVIGALLYSSPVDEMMMTLDKMQARITLIFVVAAIAACLIALLFSRWVTNPIAALTRGIQRMAKGDFSARVTVRSSGEMKHLADTFNGMSEKLESLDQSRSQFVSNASHELKTPLATMKILLENMIYEPNMPPEMRLEFMQDMNKEIDRLNAIISDLLTLVKIDSKHMELNRENLSLASLTDEIVRSLKPMAEKQGHTLIYEASNPCPVYGDPVKLRQVVYNLVDNAIKYTPNGGHISVSLIKSGRDAVLTVTDDGQGIPEEDQKHIFERFYRVDKARSRETGGTGLGLSIVSQIVRLHGGTIRVESKPNSGSSFIVELPMR